ncbi:hypothetical protein ACLKOZ_07005 [Arthrobacter sp. R4]|uniref:hypothetical protein n=1 Tax=Arthrobacter sp. R4 TaxID=644417 RepID=UPI003EDA2797
MSYQLKALSRALLAAGLTAALCAGATATALPAAAAETKLRVVQHNTDQIPERWNDVLKLAGGNDVLLAEEVCEASYETAKAAHPNWTFSFHRQKQTTAGNAAAVCPTSADGTTWKGLVAVHTGAGTATDVDFFGAEVNKAKGQTFGMACVKFRKNGNKVNACATHLQAYGDDVDADRTEQTQKIKNITKRWIHDGISVVVGGDFNTGPQTAAMTNMYQYNGEGKFVEAHQLQTGKAARAGVDTVDGRKIDYVFFSAKQTPLKSGGTFHVDRVKDGHAILTATANIK